MAECSMIDIPLLLCGCSFSGSDLRLVALREFQIHTRARIFMRAPAHKAPDAKKPSSVGPKVVQFARLSSGGISGLSSSHAAAAAALPMKLDSLASAGHQLQLARPKSSGGSCLLFIHLVGMLIDWYHAGNFAAAAAEATTLHSLKEIASS